MTTYAIPFRFFGDLYEVLWDGNMWCSPHNGQQHTTIGSAVRTELWHVIRQGGDDPADCETEIKDAIAEAVAADPLVYCPTCDDNVPAESDSDGCGCHCPNCMESL